MTTNQFTHFITQYDHALRSFALKFTKDEDEANDLMQDTMMKAIRFINKFEDGTNIKGWLYTIMRNTFINNYRKTSKKNELITQSDEISSANLFHSATNNIGEGNFLLGDIKGAINVLPKILQIPFVKYVEGYKYEEIAQELNIPLGTVKTRIHEARKHLSRKLKMYKQGIN
ncbi:RNA polymerase sigma factor [Pedobacter sp.]|uniref:RNA polymerase sigma factor n=1 Tax=Pedobacter sp. TaxID=1411316 RepID=UPI003C5214DD